MSDYKVAKLDEIPRRDTWIPVRDTLGVQSFGVNAYRGDEAGGRVINDHIETIDRHEELYIVTDGRATFTLDGEEFDAPAGTLVFVAEPTVRRAAVAAQPGTTVLVAGGPPGRPYTVAPWEESWEAGQEAMARYREQDYRAAADLLRVAVEENPKAAGLFYNLACFESLAGADPATVTEHLRRAIELYAGFGDFARDDSDFAPVRDDPGFQALLGDPPPPEERTTDGPGYRVMQIEDIEQVSDGRVPWRAIGMHLDVAAFGVNAFGYLGAGERIINEHDESDTSHEELYAITQGRARFEVDGEVFDAPAGTFVLVAPQATRTVFAEEDGTALVAFGGEPGKAYQQTGWPVWAPLHPLYEAGDYEGVIAQGGELIEAHPTYGGPLYNLACCESLAGHPADAVEHLRAAIDTWEEFREMAAGDSDFDPIRDDPAFQELVPKTG